MADQINVLCYDITTGKKKIQPITKTGTYVGDGEVDNTIEGIGVSPNSVSITERQPLSGQAIEVCETNNQIIDDIGEGMSIIHRTGGAPPHATLSDRIVSLDADGFTVSDGDTDDNPNKDGITYNYRATI